MPVTETVRLVLFRKFCGRNSRESKKSGNEDFQRWCKVTLGGRRSPGIDQREGMRLRLGAIRAHNLLNGMCEYTGMKRVKNGT